MPSGGHPQEIPAPVGPKKRNLLPIVLGIVVAVVAIGGAVYVATQGDDDSTAFAPDDLTADDLVPHLLTVDEVGGDFTETDRGVSPPGDSDDDFDGFPAECQSAIDALNEEVGDSEEPGAEATFEIPDQQELTTNLTPFRSGNATLGEIRDLFSTDCSEPFTVTQDGYEYEMALAASAIDGPGDDTMTLQMTVDHDLFTLEAYSVMWLRDGVVASVAIEGEEPSQEDRDRVHELAGIADQRLQDGL